MNFGDVGKLIIYTGIVFVIFGLVILFFTKVSSLNKVPGDIYFKKGNFSFYFPIATSIIISIILTILFNLFGSGE